MLVCYRCNMRFDIQLIVIAFGKVLLSDRYSLATFCRQKVAQKPRGDNFRGHTRKFSKTDAVALLLREKVSVF